MERVIIYGIQKVFFFKCTHESMQCSWKIEQFGYLENTNHLFGLQELVLLTCGGNTIKNTSNMQLPFVWLHLVESSSIKVILIWLIFKFKMINRILFLIDFSLIMTIVDKYFNLIYQIIKVRRWIYIYIYSLGTYYAECILYQWFSAPKNVFIIENFTFF